MHRHHGRPLPILTFVTRDVGPPHRSAGPAPRVPTLFSFIGHGIASRTARTSLVEGPSLLPLLLLLPDLGRALSLLRLLSPASVQPLRSSLYSGRHRPCPSGVTRYPTFRLRLKVDDHLRMCDGDIEEPISDDDDVGSIEGDAGAPSM